MNNHQKRVLIISPFFYPEPISTGLYNTDLALKLVEKGNKVHVWCFHPFYPGWKLKKTNQKIKGVKIKRGKPIIPFLQNQFIDRLILEVAFLRFVLIRKVKCKQSFDKIIFISPPTLSLIVLKAFKKNSNKVIIVHDLQFIHLKKKSDKLSKLVFFIEKKLMRSSNKLIFLSEEMKSFFDNSKQFANSSINVQRPFVNIEKRKSQKPILKKGINIVYSGALGAKQSPEKLLSLFEYTSNQNKDWNFYFFSSGGYFEALKKAVKTPKFTFYHWLIKKKYISFMQKAQFRLFRKLRHLLRGHSHQNYQT
jgi:glycosyltransferase involved in cell wall biosynthesis